MSKVISHTTLTPTIELTEYNGGWWLYDTTRGMNLAMAAKTQTDAFVQSLKYYQNRLQDVEKELKQITTKVEKFIGQFIEEEE